MIRDNGNHPLHRRRRVAARRAAIALLSLFPDLIEVVSSLESDEYLEIEIGDQFYVIDGNDLHALRQASAVVLH